jgi:hypothetical protein
MLFDILTPLILLIKKVLFVPRFPCFKGIENGLCEKLKEVDGV